MLGYGDLPSAERVDLSCQEDRLPTWVRVGDPNALADSYLCVQGVGHTNS
jgi:hypothetical protein